MAYVSAYANDPNSFWVLVNVRTNTSADLGEPYFVRLRPNMLLEEVQGVIGQATSKNMNQYDIMIIWPNAWPGNALIRPTKLVATRCLMLLSVMKDIRGCNVGLVSRA